MRNPTKDKYNSVPYGHILVPLHVTLRILQIVDLQEFVAPYSYKRPFHIFFCSSDSYCAFLIPSFSIQVSYWR